MEYKLDKNSTVPSYLQLKKILESIIRSGNIQDDRLPTIRQVAKDFDVSVNTVLRAYNELGKEGIVTGIVGRGTFVNSASIELEQHNREIMLEKVIEHSLEEALALDFTIDEFERAAMAYTRKKRVMMQKIRLVFIECNIEQLTYFTEHLELDPHIHRVILLLKDLRQRNEETTQKINTGDIFVTSFYHLKEVQGHLGGIDKPIIGINIEPEVATLIKVAKIPPNSTVGIITTSEQFAAIIREILEGLNIKFPRILEASSPAPGTLQNIVRLCDAVLVSPKQKKAVQQHARREASVIEFVFTPDRTSINNLKVALLELDKNAY